jgi:hypothetical protein
MVTLLQQLLSTTMCWIDLQQTVGPEKNAEPLLN